MDAGVAPGVFTVGLSLGMAASPGYGRAWRSSTWKLVSAVRCLPATVATAWVCQMPALSKAACASYTPLGPDGEIVSGAVLSGGITVPGVGKKLAVTGALSWHGPLALAAPRKQNWTWMDPKDTPRWSLVKRPIRYRAGGPTARSKLAVSAERPLGSLSDDADDEDEDACLLPPPPPHAARRKHAPSRPASTRDLTRSYNQSTGRRPQAGLFRGFVEWVLRNCGLSSSLACCQEYEMSVIDPLARHLEHFVYGRVCALSDLLHPDRGGSTVPN